MLGAPSVVSLWHERSVAVEIQLPSNKKVVLLDTTSAPVQILAVSNLDHIITYEMKDLGGHM